MSPLPTSPGSTVPLMSSFRCCTASSVRAASFRKSSNSGSCRLWGRVRRRRGWGWIRSRRSRRGVCGGKATGELPAQASEAMEGVVSRHGRALVEQFISGPELTVGLLEEKALAPIRIVPKRGFFDYEAKYKANDTEHRFDTGLSHDLIERCRELARRANEVVGARDLARIDIMIDQQTQQPYLLEINTLPGFTPKSLLPE